MNKDNQVASSELQIRGLLCSGSYFEAFIAFRLALMPQAPTTMPITSFHTASNMNCQRLRQRAMVKEAIATVIKSCIMERHRSNFPALSLLQGQYGFLPKPSTSIVQYVST